MMHFHRHSQDGANFVTCRTSTSPTCRVDSCLIVLRGFLSDHDLQGVPLPLCTRVHYTAIRGTHRGYKRVAKVSKEKAHRDFRLWKL